MGNIVKVNCGKAKSVTSAPLWQYDYGQILKIEGIELPTAYQVHFSNEPYGTSTTSIGIAEGVEIPDAYLQSGADVYAWLYLHEGEDDGETVLTIRIPVQARAAITNDEPTPVQQDEIDELITALNIAVDAAEDAEDAAEAAAEAIENMGVSASTLAAGSSATVTKTVDPETGAVSLAFGIPKGDTGAQGPAGQDGQDGADGQDGQDGQDGVDGQDGYSPTVAVTEITGGHRVTITDADGDHTFDVMDGEGGGGGTSDYEDLENLPTLNGETLIGDMESGDLGIPTQADLSALVSAWLAENITEDPTVVLDKSLSVSGAAADAAAVGGLKIYKLSDANVYRVKTSSTTESADGTRLRVVLYVPVGAKYNIQYDEAPGAAVVLYDTEAHAIYAGSSGRIASISGETRNLVTGSVTSSGYLLVSLRKSDSSKITDAQKAEILSKLQFEVAPKPFDKVMDYVKEVAGRAYSDEVIYELANGTIINPSNDKAVYGTNAAVVTPGDKVTIYTDRPAGGDGYVYAYGIRTMDEDGNILRDFSYSISTKGDSDYTIEAGERYFQATIAEYKGSSSSTLNALRVSDFTGYKLSLQITNADGLKRLESFRKKDIKDEYQQANELNRDMDGAVVAASGVNYYKSGGQSSPVSEKHNLSFAVITDLHGSKEPFERFRNYCNAHKAYLDFAICLGDTVATNPAQDVSWMDAIADSFEIPFYYTVGNHDTSDTGLSGITQAQARTKYFSKIIEKEWLEASDFEDTGKCSWVKDLDDYKIRMISLFEYGNSLEVSSSAPGAYCRRWIDTDTLQWFADTLYATPAGYRAMVFLHQIPYYPISYVDNGFTAASEFRNLSSSSFLNTVDGSPIEEIVDAFMNSTAISKTYSSIASYSLGKTATVAKDFSGRSEEGDFIGYFVGHLHQPFIFKGNTYTDQYTVGIPSGSANLYQRHWDDIPYEAKTRNMDNFYVIGIDSDRTAIDLVKIGGQQTVDFNERKTGRVITATT